MHICQPPHGLIDTPSLLALALLSADGSHPGSLCGCTAESRHCSAATLHPSCSPRSSSCSSCSSIFTHAPHPAASNTLLYITSQPLYARARAPLPLHVPRTPHRVDTPLTDAPPHAPCTPPRTLIPPTQWLYSRFHAAESGRWCAHPDIRRKTTTASITTWTILLYAGLSTREAVTVGT